jgi:two-component system, chemotaxis family, chemotaxis protein CheY
MVLETNQQNEGTTLADLTVLVVDDDRFTRSLIVAMLKKMGIKGAREAEDVGGAFRALSGGGIDVVLCDVQMRQMNGVAFLRHLRAGDVPSEIRTIGALIDPAIPVIMITGHTSADVVAKARDAGADGFIAKPIRPDILNQQIRAVLPFVGGRCDSRMHRVLYASTLSLGVGRDDVVDIFKATQQRNFRRGVFGILFLEGQNVLQVLEGPRSAVETIFKAISNDRRHSDVQVLFKDQITDRIFGGFGLGVLMRQNEGMRGCFDKMVGSGAFQPQGMTADKALRFLMAMSQFVPASRLITPHDEQ